MMRNYEVLINTFPTLDEYIYLCSSVGWKDYMNFEVQKLRYVILYFLLLLKILTTS